MKVNNVKVFIIITNVPITKAVHKAATSDSGRLIIACHGS